jgi:hypothetical protein
MLGNYRVSKQLGISRVVLSSMELVPLGCNVTSREGFHCSDCTVREASWSPLVWRCSFLCAEGCDLVPCQNGGSGLYYQCVTMHDYRYSVYRDITVA